VASPLQKAPRGLLELFALKTLGRAPELFSNEVRPSVDVRDLYSADLVTAQAAQTGGAGVAATLTVPTGQVWLVDGLSCDLTLTVGAVVDSMYLSAVLSWQRIGGISVHLHEKSWENVGGTAGVWSPVAGTAQSLATGMFFERPLVCLPGSILRADFLGIFSGTATDSYIQCRYALLT